MFDNFYKIYISIFLVCIDLIAGTCLGMIIHELMISNSFSCLIVLFIFIPMFCYFIYFNYYFFKYYLNNVKRITISNGEMIVLIAKKIYTIPIDKVLYVKNAKITQRVIILYNDGIKNRKFIAHTYKNNPLRIERLDFEELKRNLPYTKFI